MQSPFLSLELLSKSLLSFSLILSFSLSIVLSDNDGFCSSAESMPETYNNNKPMYWKVTNPTLSPNHLQDLPGFTRSVYKKDHALITPESHVFSPLPDWSNTLGAYLITPAMGSHFVMYLAKMQENSRSGLPPQDVERFIFVVQGDVRLTNASSLSNKLTVDSVGSENIEHQNLDEDWNDQLVKNDRWMKWKEEFEKMTLLLKSKSRMPEVVCF